MNDNITYHMLGSLYKISLQLVAFQILCAEYYTPTGHPLPIHLLPTLHLLSSTSPCGRSIFPPVCWKEVSTVARSKTARILLYRYTSQNLANLMVEPLELNKNWSKNEQHLLIVIGVDIKMFFESPSSYDNSQDWAVFFSSNSNEFRLY